MKNSPEREMIERYEYRQEFKDRLVFEVLYEGKTKDEIVDEYDLAGVQTITLWIRHYKRRMKLGAISLPPMTKEQKKNEKGLRERLKEMERALEEANVLIFGLNTMIDLAEEEFQIPIRKKGGTKR